MFCPNCGSQIEDGARFCPECGTQMDAAEAPQMQQLVQAQPQMQQPPFQPQPYAAQGDGQHKLTVRAASLLCYWFSFVGWIVSYMLADNRDQYLRFHLNQSLVLWLASLAAFLLMRVPLGLIYWLGSLLSLAVFVLWLIAFIHAYKGEAKYAPLLDRLPPLIK